MEYIAFATKGLEKISAEEIKQISGVTLISVKQKYIHFKFDGDLADLKILKTIDDLGILIREFETEDLKDGNFENTFDFAKIQEVIKTVVSKYRKTDDRFAVTMSFYKADKLDKVKVKQDLANHIAQTTKLNYIEKDHSNLDFRFNIEEDRGFLTLKAFSESLYTRNYTHKTEMGSLRSTIVGTMVFHLVSNIKRDKKDKSKLKLVDNYCGSGTFLCEAHLIGIEAFGGDNDLSQVKLSVGNLERAGVKNPEVYEQDCRKTRWESRFFDLAVSNVPWNKQIEIKNVAALYEDSIKEYSRILKTGSPIAIISNNPDIIKKYFKQYFNNYRVEEYRIGYIGQTPTISFGFAE